MRTEIPHVRRCEIDLPAGVFVFDTRLPGANARRVAVGFDVLIDASINRRFGQIHLWTAFAFAGSYAPRKR